MQLRMDDGLEFISTILAEWADEHDIHLELLNQVHPCRTHM